MSLFRHLCVHALTGSGLMLAAAARHLRYQRWRSMLTVDFAACGHRPQPQGWVIAKARPPHGGAAGQGASELLRSAAEEEARLGAHALEFYRAALPAVPTLLAGFLCREGAELVRAPSLPDAVRLPA